MTTALLILFCLLPRNSHATALAVMEQTKTSHNTIFVDTRAARLDISTQSYNGHVANVGLYSSSNIVVSNTNTDNCVIYATGSISCTGSISGSTVTQSYFKYFYDDYTTAASTVSTTLNQYISFTTATVSANSIGVSNCLYFDAQIVSNFDNVANRTGQVAIMLNGQNGTIVSSGTFTSDTNSATRQNMRFRLCRTALGNSGIITGRYNESDTIQTNGLQPDELQVPPYNQVAVDWTVTNTFSLMCKVETGSGKLCNFTSFRVWKDL